MKGGKGSEEGSWRGWGYGRYGFYSDRPRLSAQETPQNRPPQGSTDTGQSVQQTQPQKPKNSWQEYTQKQAASEATAVQPSPETEPPPREQQVAHSKPKAGGGFPRAVLGVILVLAIGIGAYYLYLSKGTQVTLPVNTTMGMNYSVSSCKNIAYPGTYYLAGDIFTSINNGACINIRASNVRLMGNGHRITGSGPFVASQPFTYGIEIDGVNNVTVGNIIIAKFSYDVYSLNSNMARIVGVNALNATMSGIYLNNTYLSTISDDQVSGAISSQGGIFLLGGGNNTIDTDIVKNNAVLGIEVNSSGNRFSNDTFKSNPLDLQCGLYGHFRNSNYFLQSFCQTNIFCNFAYCSKSNRPSLLDGVVLPSTIRTCGVINVSGKYAMVQSLNLSSYLNTSNPLSSQNACILINSPNVRLDCRNNTIYNAWYGIFVKGVYNTTLTNCGFNNNTYGALVAGSFQTNITNMKASKNAYALYLYNSTKGNVSSSVFSNNRYGVYVNTTTNFVFSNINSTRNDYGVYAASGSSNFYNRAALFGNNKRDLFCTAGSFNTTSNIFQNPAKCGSTDCNWATKSCALTFLPPLPAFPVTTCGDIIAPGNYSLQQNLISSTNCFRIRTGNVTFNCNNRIVAGTGGGGSAFYINRENNVTLVNCKVSLYQYGYNVSNSAYVTLNKDVAQNTTAGFVFTNTTYSRISNTTAVSSGSTGFLMTNVNRTLISNNTARNGIGNANGFLFINSYNDLVSYNNATLNPSLGFSFTNSRGNNVHNNAAFSNQKLDYSCAGSSAGLYAENGGVNSGLTKSNCQWLVELNQVQVPQCYALVTPSQVTLTSDMLYTFGGICFSVYNTKTTLAQNILINCNWHTVLSSSGGTFLDVINGTNVRLENCYLKNFITPIQSSGVGTTITNVTVGGANYSILITNTTTPTINNNFIVNSTYGIYLLNARFGSILNNNFTNVNTSIELTGSSSGYKIYNNTAQRDTVGLYLANSQSNLLQGNKLLNSSLHGIWCTLGATNSSSVNKDLGNNVCSSNFQCYWMSASSPLCAPAH